MQLLVIHFSLTLWKNISNLPSLTDSSLASSVFFSSCSSVSHGSVHCVTGSIMEGVVLKTAYQTELSMCYLLLVRGWDTGVRGLLPGPRGPPFTSPFTRDPRFTCDHSELSFNINFPFTLQENYMCCQIWCFHMTNRYCGSHNLTKKSYQAFFQGTFIYFESSWIQGEVSRWLPDERTG